MGVAQPGHCVYSVVDAENQRETDATSDVVVLDTEK